MVYIKKTFENWLQGFNSKLRIMELKSEGVDPGRADIDVLYYGSKRLCSVPKGLKRGIYSWEKINDIRSDKGYCTADKIQHRTITGIGHILLTNHIINPEQFINYFLTGKNKQILQQIIDKGYYTWKGFKVPIKNIDKLSIKG